MRTRTGVLAVADDLDEVQLVADELVLPEGPGEDTVWRVEVSSAPTRPNGLEELGESLPLILISPLTSSVRLLACETRCCRAGNGVVPLRFVI